MSMNQSVLICDQVNPVLNEILEKNGLQITYEPEITPEQILEKIENFEVIIVRSRTKITKDMIEKANKCQIIARVGVGLDNIDQAAAKEKNIRVINAVEGAMNAVAELVIGLMLSLAREIPRADREVRNGNWIKKELMGTELRGKYLGIVGLGNIGKHVAQIAKGFGMEILVNTRTPDPSICDDMKIKFVSLETIFKISDFIVSSSIEPEAFGRVAVEAQSMGKPIIASMIGGSKETIIDNITGFLFAAGDINSLSQKLAHVFELDETTLKSIGNEGRKNVTNKFNVEKMCFTTYSEYKKLLS